MLTRPVLRWVRYADLTEAVDAVLAHDGLLRNWIVNGVVSSHLGHPLYLRGADGDEEVWEHWFKSTPHRLHIPAPERRPHRRDLYVHTWQ
jgi:hypothetical protein